MDVCRFKGTSYYSTMAKALTSGTFRGLPIKEYFLGDMKYNGEKLSNGDKSSLLNNIQRDLEKVNELTPEVEKTFEEIRTELNLAKDTFYPSRVVVTPNFSDSAKLQLFKVIPSKSKRILDISDVRGKMISILNLDLNNYITSVILSSLKEVCLWDENAELIISNDRELTLSILNYRNSLILTLNKFVGESNVMLSIGNLGLSEVDAYNKLMQDSWDKIKNILNSFNGEINISTDEENLGSVVNPIMAFYVLQNFDLVLSMYLNDFITISPSEFGNINASKEKYKRKANKKLNSSYNDDTNSSDAENLLDTIFDTFITSIQLSNGKFLDKKFKENLLCVVRDAVENKNIVVEKLGRDETKMIQTLSNILANKTTSADLSVQDLIKILSGQNSITEKVGQEACKKIADRLTKFINAVERKKISSTTSKQEASLDSEYNVGYRLLNYLATKGVIGQTSVTGNYDTNSVTPGTKQKSKKYVRDRVAEALSDTLSTNKRLLTSSSPLLIGRVSADNLVDLYSESAKEVLTKITGLNFRDDEVIERFSTEENLLKLASFLSKYREVVRNYANKEASKLLNNKQEFINDVLDILAGTGEYIDFSDILVLENEFELQRMFDQQLKEQARTTIATLSTQFSQCFSDFNDFVKTRAGNILLKFPTIIKQTHVLFSEDNNIVKTSDFNQFITFAGDCKFLNGDVVRWVKLRPNEINTAYLNQLYLYNVLKHNTLTFQIDVTSDKMKTPLANLNLQQVNFVRYSMKSLNDIKHLQLKDYYDTVKDQIFDFFEKILGVRYNNLLELDKALLKTSLEDIFEKIREIQKNDDYKFTALPEVFYSIVKGKVCLNRSLCYEMFKCENQALQNEYDLKVFEHYKKTLIDQGVKLSLTDAYIDSLDDNLKTDLVSMFFDVNPYGNDYNKACNDIKLILKEDSSFNNEKLDYFLKKFITLQNIARESAVQIFNKHYWVHGKGTNISLEELSNVSSSKHEETLMSLVSNEMKKRIEKSTKRNNSQSATMAPMDLGFKHGVPQTIRVASILSLNKVVHNNFGTSQELHAHDGAIWSAHLLRIWERNSQTQMHMANNTKIIALLPNDSGFYQIKCADYSMTNAWIRNSITLAESNSDQYVDGKALYKKMLSPAKLTKFLEEFAYDDYKYLNLGLDSVFYNFQGNLARLDSIEADTDANGNIVLIPYWTYSNGEAVPSDVIGDTFELNDKFDNYTGGFRLENLYDLWNFFGGENSQSMNSETGEIDFSDISQEYVAYLIDEYDPSLKSKIISKICDPEAVKSTPFPINSRTDVYESEKQLMSVNLHTRYYGPQLDYSHETDEDTIPFTTLVIGAIAFNGENSELVQDLYETIGDITAESLAEITGLSNLTNKTKLYKKIGKLVANNLKSNGVISNASTVLDLAIKMLVDDDSVFAKSAIPLSDNQLYHAATAQILSKLNKMIKLRFAGTAVVQNPAQGIISVYQDANGITYNKSALIKKALDWYKDSGLTGLFKTDAILNAYLNRDGFGNAFAKQPVIQKDNSGNIVTNDFHLLNIADNVEVYLGDIDFIEKTYPELHKALKPSELGVYNLEIQDPFILYLLVQVSQLENSPIFGISKVFTRPRNLATTLITFLDLTGKYTNFWLLGSTQAVLKDKSDDITIAKMWHKANIRGIGDKTNPYYYATESDFINNIQTRINKDSIVYKGGEQVLPKQYKRKYSVNGYMSDILERGLDYFEDLARFRMKVDPLIDLNKYGKKSFAISTNDFDVIFADPGTQVGENVTLEDNGNGYYSLYTEDDELIQNIKLPKNIGYSIQYTKGNKPTIIIVPDTDITYNNEFANALVENLHINSTKLQETQTYSEILTGYNESTITDEQVKELAQKLYTSFRLTNKTVSVRIPSQSFQSFLPNDTVLFTEDDENNGYMNLWEMWFLGSDYDIKSFVDVNKAC